MKKFILFVALFFMGYSNAAYAKCVGASHVWRTDGTSKECQEQYKIQRAQEKERKRLELEEQALILENKKRAINKGYQSGNSGTVVNVGGMAGLTGGESNVSDGENPLSVESQLEIFISSALFELSPQQPGAKRQFLMSQNSGGTALGARYKFAKGVHLFGMYEKFRYKGKEFKNRAASTTTIQTVDEFGNPAFDPETGEAIMEEIASVDNSYTWAGGYEHVRYALGIGFRGTLSDEQMITWTFDVIPMGWFETNYIHNGGSTDTHAASKAYGFRASVNKHISSDFSLSAYYQLFDAQKEAADYADEFKPMGSQEFGVTMNFGLPNVLGVVY